MSLIIECYMTGADITFEVSESMCTVLTDCEPELLDVGESEANGAFHI